MSNSLLLPRRRFLRIAAAGAGASMLAGCNALSKQEGFVDVLSAAEPLNRTAQRFLSGDRLVREYPAHMIARSFRANGSTDPQTPEYLSMVAQGFGGYQLRLRGLVDRPMEFNLDALRALPSRTQITRHDCVEGWSVIGQWTGVPLAHLLLLAGVQTAARYAVFHCFDDFSNNGSRYYESCDLRDAMHPQTIAAYALNGSPLPVANGAPLRMRIERKLGYKQPKYVHTIELVDSYARMGGGNGGYWEDLGYDWYGGI